MGFRFSFFVASSPLSACLSHVVVCLARAVTVGPGVGVNIMSMKILNLLYYVCV